MADSYTLFLIHFRRLASKSLSREVLSRFVSVRRSCSLNDTITYYISVIKEADSTRNSSITIRATKKVESSIQNRNNHI